MLSSTEEAPELTSLSTGVRSPGRITSSSPTSTCSRGNSSSRPARTTRAVVGGGFSSASTALPVARRERVFSQCPASEKVVSMAAVSKNTSPERRKRVAPSEYSYDTRMPVAIGVIMLAPRCRHARQAAEMNGQPPHHTTGVERIRPNQAMLRPKGGGP
ncbi:hypothetical protein [Deinococcus sp.]|uniref:hypothetical protein n=1 Tax=Deinococcus sp. TaxID=47478 RepID=UPI003C7B1768